MTVVGALDGSCLGTVVGQLEGNVNEEFLLGEDVGSVDGEIDGDLDGS